MNTKTIPPFANLPDWLRWQEQLHPNAIDMGLERVHRVLERMQPAKPAFHVLTVGGTNGKGSCVTFLEAMLRAQGYKVGAYTSPHLLRYNERVRVEGVEAGDQEFCDAFAKIDAARGDISLTYFEFGTLAAFEIFNRHQIEIAVLEVGMGGRLDAVNVLEPDAALVVSVGLDHQEWLGNDRDSIGYEKAGIYRSGRPAICGDREPPARLLETARQRGAHLRRLGTDFDWTATASGWRWYSGETALDNLPPPSLPGRIQFDNASSAIAVLQALPVLEVSVDAIRAGLISADLPARFQRVSGPVEMVFDVAHNPDAARVLAANLVANPVSGRTVAVIGMFRDKAVEAVTPILAPQIDEWFVGALEGPRGQTAAGFAARVRSVVPDAVLNEYADVGAACDAADARTSAGDRIVVCGSFQTVSVVLQQRQTKPANITG
ncbi:MAG TPA: bifunctional tetrahydrofolate synthase/dihydrofolate synthase [Gammaproteobacteria bacterium]|nr:bifunctional tetrahydrofolate synthase/dihydrofolate synthase [Gammaproteobacteria bacterium]